METSENATDAKVDYYDRLGDTYGKGKGPLHYLFDRTVRNREIDIVMDLAQIRAGESVLDAGCGPGLYARRCAEAGASVWALDSSPRMVEAARPYVEHAFVADMTTLSLGRKFDKVLSIGVLEFIQDTESAIRALCNHVGPGGRLVLLFPTGGTFGKGYRLVQRLRGMTVYHLDEKEIERLVHKQGLQVISAKRPFLHNIVMSFHRPT